MKIHEEPRKNSNPLAPGERVFVRCKGFRCLGYRDRYGNWRDAVHGYQLPEVLEITRLFTT